MYELKANFYPATEPKNGYIGKARLIVADAIRINDISVFQKEDKSYHFQFTEWGEGNKYVALHNTDVYADVLGVISKAVEAENHFAAKQGKVALRMKDYQDKKKEVIIDGHSVNEKYADARYNLTIDGFCTLYGITSVYKTFDKDGKQRGFVAVDMPTIKDTDGSVKMFTDGEGNDRASLVFEGVKHKIKDQDGKEAFIDYNVKIVDAIRSEHQKLRKPSLDGQVAEADAQKTTPNKEKVHEQDGPAL